MLYGEQSVEAMREQLKLLALLRSSTVSARKAEASTLADSLLVILQWRSEQGDLDSTNLLAELKSQALK